MKNIKYIIPIVMCLFFARNIYLSETQKMDTWMGGGMRMFAEIDKSLQRVVLVNLQDASGNEVQFNLNDIQSLKEENLGLRVLPSEKKAKKIASLIRQNSEVTTKYPDFKNIKESSVKVVVHKVNFSKESNTVSLKAISKYEFPAK